MGNREDAERACARLATACYTLMDLGRYDETAALFAEDATWVRGGNPTVGRAAIRAALDKRPADQISRHVVTNVVVTVLDDDNAEGAAYFMPLRGARKDGAPAVMPAFDQLGDLAFRFRRGADGWRIAFLKPSPAFKA
jgi:ketosteroid isomerase-like protein